MARGFRSFGRFQSMVFLKADDLKLALQSVLPT
jgi:hypothetical protein